MNKHNASISVTLLVVLVLTVSLVGTVSAISGGSTFDATNGSLTDSTLHDWNPAGSPAGNVGPVQAIKCPASVPGAGTNCGLDRTNSSLDDSFANGAKEDDLAPSVGTGSIPPNKDDLSRFYVNQEKVNGNDFLYFAWERTNLLGSAHLDFEFNQSNALSANGVTTARLAGDMLITFDFGGSGVPVLSLSRWITTGAASQCEVPSDGIPCWGILTNLTATGVAEGSVNSTNVLDYNPPNAPTTLIGSTANNGTISSTFGEAAVNLTGSGIFPTNVCEHFGTASLKSRSSGSSFTSTLKDFIAPIPINITNCGTITLIKHTNPRGANFNFGFNSPAIAGAIYSHPLDGSGNFTLNDNGNTNADSAGNTQTITNVLAGGPYTFTELSPGPGFDLTGLSCSSAGGSTATTNLAARQATVTLVVGDTVTCTYTNTPRGTIIIKKVTVPSPDPTTSTFTFNPVGFNGGTAFTEMNGGKTTYANLLPSASGGGPYSITEADPSALGFDMTSATCDNGTTGNITVTAGGTTTCTFTNTLRQGAIRVTKVSVKTGSPVLAGAKFDIKDSNGNLVTTLTTGANGTACVDHLAWAGTGTNYSVTETQAPNGYAIDNASPVTVTVNHNADCGSVSGVPNTPATFTDTPLTDLVITVTSEASNGTKSTITCVDSASANIGNSPQGPVDPVSVSANGLKPGTYTCTVVVDP